MTNVRSTYRENDVRGASPVRLVVMLYDQIVQDLTRAKEALEQNEIERRTKLINHAILVIGHLQSPLDFDKGGKVAQNLENFYNVLRANLVQVQFHPSKLGIDRLITDVLAIREAWLEVDRTEKSKAAVAAVSAAPNALPSDAARPESERAQDRSQDGAQDRPHMDWQG